MECYLKCQYAKGLFSHEYEICFRVMEPTTERGMFVNKEDVISLTDEQGLVRLVEIHGKDKNCLVGINDVGDHRISRKYVFKEDIVMR